MGQLTLEVIQNDLLKFLRESILSEQVQLDPTTRLNSLGIDSFSLIQILLFIERHFQVKLPDSALTQENLMSVAAIALCVHKML
jgi:acyl carrier protein